MAEAAVDVAAGAPNDEAMATAPLASSSLLVVASAAVASPTGAAVGAIASAGDVGTTAFGWLVNARASATTVSLLVGWVVGWVGARGFREGGRIGRNSDEEY